MPLHPPSAELADVVHQPRAGDQADLLRLGFEQEAEPRTVKPSGVAYPSFPLRELRPAEGWLWLPELRTQRCQGDRRVVLSPAPPHSGRPQRRIGDAGGLP